MLRSVDLIIKLRDEMFASDGRLEILSVSLSLTSTRWLPREKEFMGFKRSFLGVASAQPVYNNNSKARVKVYSIYKCNIPYKTCVLK